MSCSGSSGDEYIPSKDSIHESSSEGSCDQMSKVPLVKLKKQKKSQRTYKEVLEAMNSDVSETEAEKDSSFFSASSSGSSSSKRRQLTTDEFGDDIEPIGFSTPKRRLQVSDSEDPTTGPQIFNSGQPTSDDPDSVDPAITGSRSKKKQCPESNRGDPKTETSKRRSWSLNEIHAVEKTLMAFIQSGKVPGKSDCVACIKASPEALKKRSWTAVKFYVKNRITAIQHESAKRVY
ncbi:uncharacterized protein [Cebidichthys violaceus]|uniref:uncharacterized protein isoform X2 n=1 Tax=Cebidichthys violaceus TaxID=271503 RepID=UPI0035CA1303